jgi:hypothetical protein
VHGPVGASGGGAGLVIRVAGGTVETLQTSQTSLGGEVRVVVGLSGLGKVSSVESGQGKSAV